MRITRMFLLTLALLASSIRPAGADVTAFVGANTVPDNRALRGAAIGIGLLVVSFEFEYAATSNDHLATTASLKTGSGNLLLQTPMMVHGFQPYFTIGAGLYRETLGNHVDTGVAPNSGGGVKIHLAGPVRLRVDYRVFRLGNGALYSPAHRIYAGLNLKF
ncbi:MAG: hypothetical protein ABL961_03730 [Vicinamibacterales bacterium]